MLRRERRGIRAAFQLGRCQELLDQGKIRPRTRTFKPAQPLPHDRSCLMPRCTFASALFVCTLTLQSTAQQPKLTETAHAKFVAYHGYKQAVELTRGDVRAVLCADVGGRLQE